MEMIAVMRCPRPEHRLELAARIAPDIAEEFTFGELAAPSLLHRHFATALEREGGKVDGITEAMFAHSCAR